MVDHDNAASRLLYLLNAAKSISPDTPSLKAWEELLDARKNPAMLLARMGRVMALPEEISTTLSNTVGTDPSLVEHIARQFHVAFTTHKFGEKWGEFSNRIDPHMLTYLSLASTLLETHSQSKRLAPDEIDNLRKGFSELLDQVRAAGISEKLKGYVVAQLHDLISALDNYFISGGEPVLEKIEATLGHAYRDSEYRSFLTNDQIGARFLNCLSAAANLVTVAIGIPQMAHLGKLLEHLSSP